MSAGWQDAWEGFELTLMSQQRSPLTIRNARSVVTLLTRHMTSQGTEPAEVTKSILNKFLLAQYKDREPGGQVAFFQQLKNFWDWHATEHGTASGPSRSGRSRRASHEKLGPECR